MVSLTLNESSWPNATTLTSDEWGKPGLSCGSGIEKEAHNRFGFYYTRTTLFDLDRVKVEK